MTSLQIGPLDSPAKAACRILHKMQQGTFGAGLTSDQHGCKHVSSNDLLKPFLVSGDEQFCPSWL